MATAAVKRLRWQLAHLSRAVGLPGWVGAVLLLACAVGWWAVALPLRAEATRLDAASAALERRLEQRGAVVRLPATPQQQLAQFERRFTAENGIAPALARLHAVARRQGVRLDQAEFRFASEAGEPLSRYSIVLPVKADYRALRRFTRAALLELPGLAIEEVNLRRNDPKAALLDAQLRFVLFVTKPG
ncbi:MAG: hypothetical protein V4569_08035 [Pseudomonadota bacterium]